MSDTPVDEVDPTVQLPAPDVEPGMGGTMQDNPNPEHPTMPSTEPRDALAVYQDQVENPPDTGPVVGG